MRKIGINAKPDEIARAIQDIQREVDLLKAGNPTIRGPLDMRGYQITNLGDPLESHHAQTRVKTTGQYAPASSRYVIIGPNDANLTGERILTAGTNVTITDNGPNSSVVIDGNSGTVTSVAVTGANGIGVSGSPITSSGTIALTLGSLTGLTGISSSGTIVFSGLSSNGLVKTSGGTGTLSIATSGTDYEVPLTFSTGLTRTTNTVTVNTSQNIATLSNLTTNGFVKTSGGTGALSIDTSTYLTGNQTITLSGDVSGSGATSITTTIGASKVTNTMLAGSITAAKLVGTDIATVGTITSGTWNGTKIGLAYGGTNADLSATGGTSQVLKQVSAGAAITVAQLSTSDISGIGAMATGAYPGSGIANSTGSAWGTSYSTTGSGTVVALATSPSFTTPTLGVATATSVQQATNGTQAFLGKPSTGTNDYSLGVNSSNNWIWRRNVGGVAGVGTLTFGAASSGAAATALFPENSGSAGGMALGDPGTGAQFTYVYTKGSTSGTQQWIPAAAAGSGTVITFPATTGTVVTTGDTGTVTNTMLAGSIAASKLVGTDIATVGSVTAGTWNATKIGLAYGGTNADLSATGGTSQVLKQVSSGAAVTVGQLAASDLSNGTTGSGSVVLSASPTGTGTWALPIVTATSINATRGGTQTSLGTGEVGMFTNRANSTDNAFTAVNSGASGISGVMLYRGGTKSGGIQSNGTGVVSLSSDPASLTAQGWYLSNGAGYQNSSGVSVFDINTSGSIDTYAGSATAGNGVSAVLASTSGTTQAAALSASALYTPAAAGLYRVSFAVTLTRAATSSSTLAGAGGIKLNYTTGDSSTAVNQQVPCWLTTSTTATVTNSAANTVGTTLIGSVVVYSSTTAMTFDIGYTSSGATSMQYAYHVTVERLA